MHRVYAHILLFVFFLYLLGCVIAVPCCDKGNSVVINCQHKTICKDICPSSYSNLTALMIFPSF